MSSTAILVIGGGPSEEREISLLSSKAVYSSLKSQSMNVEFYDWDGTTNWLDDNLKRFDVILPILHGKGCEDGAIQKILENHNCNFLGSSSEVSSICFNKQATLTMLDDHGFTIPIGFTVTKPEYTNHKLSKTSHVLKPFNGGSSIDTYIFSEPIKLPMSQINRSFKKHKKMLLEEYVDGIEITVPILNKKSLPVVEIQPPKNGVFDYANKYNGTTKELCPPHNLTLKQQAEAQKLAVDINKLLGCRHISRVDMIFKDGKFYILEVNTIPGLSDKSLYPKSAAEAGLDFDKLIYEFVKLVKAGI